MAATCLMNDKKKTKARIQEGARARDSLRGHALFLSLFHRRETYLLLRPMSCFLSPANDAITLWIHEWINHLTRSTPSESNNLPIVHYLALEP